MGQLVEVRFDFHDVLLPPSTTGRLYQSGDRVALTDAEFGSLPPGTARCVTVVADIGDDQVPTRGTPDIMTILRNANVSAGLTWTAVKTAAYTAKANDAIPVDTTGGTLVITLGALAADAKVRVKWQAGTAAPTIAVTGSGVTLDTTWPGFGQVGDSADFHLQGTTWVLV